MLGRLLRSPDPVVEERATYSLQQMAGLIVSSGSGTVTTDQALTMAACSACVDVLSSSVSSTPIDVVRVVGNTRQPVQNTPQVIAAPSALVEPDVWRYQLVESMLTDGNGFGIVTSVDAMQRPTGIELVDPSTVTNRRVDKGVAQADIGGDTHLIYPHGDLWHVPGKLVRAGSPFAASPIVRARETISTALAARRFGYQFFDEGGHPSSIVYADRELDADQAKAIKQAYIQATKGNREPAVFGAGLKHEQISVDPNDSQFIELMRFVIEEACRFWLVPPSMVFAATSGQNVTYANVSQADVHYLKHSVEWLFGRLETAQSKLIARPQIVRFNRNAFLRADASTRGEYLDKRLRNKSISVNEYRSLEDEEPFADEDFDLPGIPGGPTDAPAAPGGTP